MAASSCDSGAHLFTPFTGSPTSQGLSREAVSAKGEMTWMPLLELYVLAFTLLLTTRAYDGCTKASHVRCGTLCAEKCVCGLSPAVVYTGADSEGWCCGGKCRVTEETEDGEWKIVFCQGGNYQLLSKPCHNGCNYWPDDPDRGNRSYIACDTVRQCFPEWSLCGDKPFCADISDLDMCTHHKWHGRSCPHPSQRRCEGPYPGQCIPRAKWADGQRDCIDKSDETEREEYCTEERIQQQKEERERERRKNEQKYNKNRSKFDKEKYSTKEKNHESKSDLKKKPKREKHWTLEYIWSVHEEWVNSYISWISALIFQYVTDAASVLLKSINWIFLYVWSAVESTYLYFHCICERTDAFLLGTFKSIFLPFYNAFSGPLENLGWGFRVVTNSIVDFLCFAFNLIKTILVFLFDVIYFLVWIVGFCSSFMVFKLPMQLKNGFFTSLELLELAWSFACELFSRASNWTIWLVNSWLPKIWEEHWWEMIKASISLLTLFYALLRDD